MKMEAISAEIDKLQESLSATMREVAARESGIPESRRTTIADRSFEATGVKPNRMGKPTFMSPRMLYKEIVKQGGNQV